MPEIPGVAFRRLPLLAIGMLSMAYGTWLGLVRLGWNLPLPSPDRLVGHGPLMVCAFLGTLISLERAVALAARWAYAAPVAVAAGALTLLLGRAVPTGIALITFGSAVLVAMYVVVWRRQPSLFVFTMGAGACLWLGGNIRWLSGAAIVRVVFWWLGFLVLTDCRRAPRAESCAAPDASRAHDVCVVGGTRRGRRGHDRAMA